jgi:uncharacterized protein YbjT (DUF2867 family)
VIVLVTGASGTLGRHVVSALAGRAYAVRAMTRTPDSRFPPPAEGVVADLGSGHGVPDAVDGVEAIIHCATEPRSHRQVDRDGTRLLVETARRSGVGHIVYPGIVGADIVPLRYYRSKIAAEDTIAASGIGWTLLRSTRFHEFVWWMLSRSARLPLAVVPAGTRAQPIDPAAVATRLADALERGPSGRLPDIGGAHAYEVTQLARSYMAAIELDRRILPLNLPGIVGASLRAGANLTPNRADDGRTWNDFVAERIEARSRDGEGRST